jgi:two-component system, NtrC family, sensor kinase
MESPVLHKNEAERLQDLLDYQILDTLPEKRFDELVQIASFVCQAPISLISLVDKDRQWFKANYGIEVRELPRAISFCGHTINQSEVFEVSSADDDQRFADNPLVTGEPNIKFYAGAPLVSSQGNPMGTICVIDTKPRHMTPEQKRVLQLLANQVIALMELRKKIIEDRERMKEVERLSIEVLRQKGKLRYMEKLELLANMAAGVCHEINNPLAVITLNIESMKKHLEDSHPLLLSTQQRLDKIQNSALRIERIVKGLRLYSSSGESNVRENFYLRDLVEEALILSEEKLKQNGIQLRLSGVSAHQVIGVPSQIMQVVLNLIINSIEAIFEQKEKWIQIELEDSSEIGFAKLRIIDSGPGIHPSIAEKIMQPFFTTKDVGKGIGIGLSMCLGIIREHGGELRYEKYQGHTSFLLKLPLASFH